MRKIYKSIMNTLDQEAPEYIYKYGTWDDILFRRLITEQVAYFASPEIYGKEQDIIHKIDRCVLDENNRLQFYRDHYKKQYPDCSEDEICRMAKNALKNNIITKDKLSEFEQYWQKYTMNLLVYFAQDEPLMKKYYGEILEKRQRGKIPLVVYVFKLIGNWLFLACLVQGKNRLRLSCFIQSPSYISI